MRDASGKGEEDLVGRRDILRFAASAVPVLASACICPLLLAQSAAANIRGTLKLNSSGKPILAAKQAEVPITGDDPTMAVFLDKRVHGLEFELTGALQPNGVFYTGPIHTKAMYVLRGGQRLFVTYWCDVCSIRTYSPGVCWCCQEETDLDIRERYDN